MLDNVGSGSKFDCNTYTSREQESEEMNQSTNHLAEGILGQSLVPSCGGLYSGYFPLSSSRWQDVPVDGACLQC